MPHSQVSKSQQKYCIHCLFFLTVSCFILYNCVIFFVDEIIGRDRNSGAEGAGKNSQAKGPVLDTALESQRMQR